jgi:hypothetical protein
METIMTLRFGSGDWLRFDKSFKWLSERSKNFNDGKFKTGNEPESLF